MSQIPKFERGSERNPKSTTDFITSILAKKLERKTSAFYFILSPAFLTENVLGEKHTHTKKIQRHLLISSPKTQTFLGAGEQKRQCP